jgi:hypothetical protein
MHRAPAEPKAVVLVSREWHEPRIRIQVSVEGVSIAMELEDFLQAMVQETGNPAVVMTQAGLLKRLRLAADRVVMGMKTETARIV